MGAIKDVVDLLRDLSERVTDRRISGELGTIQRLILDIQSEHAQIHEMNIRLREEKLTQQEQIRELETKLKNASLAPSSGPSGVPTCPNCSTRSKPIYMTKLGAAFVDTFGATHECPKCKYMAEFSG